MSCFQAVDEPELIPHTFDKLVSKFKDLPIDTAPKLEACIELIYEKVRFKINWLNKKFYLSS